MPGVLPATPLLSYGIDQTEEADVEEINYGDNYSARVSRGVNPIRQTWNLIWNDITTAQKEALRTFFRGLKGQDYFTWTPTGQVTNLKFINPKGNTKAAPVGADLWNFSVMARQVFDA